MVVSRFQNEDSSSDNRLKRFCFTVTVTAAIVLGIYSLFLASANADKVKPLAEEGLIRTATAKDKTKIALAMGPKTESELVLVVIDDPVGLPEPDLEQSVRQAAQILVDSNLAASARRLEPVDHDYAAIVGQNKIGHFPAVLVVKKNGGIVKVTGNFSPENLSKVYHTVWGKSSDCGSAKNAIY